ncbi:MAG TPA: nuclear transport factor 2 family protein [Nocardioidaceae bacterium]|nr:nuclear transport factor 2 family protein [Nocardioidaceae bacterium]
MTDDNRVLELFRRAMQDDDADAIREGLLLLFDRDGGVTVDDEYAIRHDDYVLEMPQSGERISSRERMRDMQASYPGGGPSITLDRVTGSGRNWVIEGVNDYGDGDVWNTVLMVELADDGRMVRDRRYYAKQFDPPPWRAEFTDPAEA